MGLERRRHRQRRRAADRAVRARPARSPTWTPSTTARTARSTSPRSGRDFLVCSAYKFFGPHVGILYGRAELLERHRPYKVRPATDEPPHSWETGTVNLEGIAGTAAAIRYLEGVGMDAIAAYERDADRAAAGRPRVHRRVTAVRHPRPRPAVPTARFNVAGQRPGRGRPAARRARHLRVGRQLLRARADAAARPGGLRRRRPGRRRALQHGEEIDLFLEGVASV